jgi:L-ascorbate metabolism protein UlaG (beta-lactamase superfamily)
MSASLYKLNPDHILSLDGPRLGGPSIWWVLGAELDKELVDCRNRMLEHFDAGRADWFEEPAAGRFFTRDGDAVRMRDELFFCSHPNLLEGQLHLRCTRRSDGRSIRIPIERQEFDVLRRILPQLAASACRWNDHDCEDAATRTMMSTLVDRGIAVETGTKPAPVLRDDYRITFIGHACLLLETPSTRVLVDPLFNYPAHRGMDVISMLHEELDAILVSHPHWDHFHLDSMLLVDGTTPLYVPRPVSPASAVNIDSVSLAHAFGYGDVRPLSHWQSVSIGDIELLSLPFYGEGYGPEAPIDAMAYAFRLGGKTVAGFVDTCADHFGDMDEVARQLHAQWGDIDFLFAPCTNFQWPMHVYPRRPFFMSHDKEQFTGSPQDCLRWAGLLHTRRLIPYAAFLLDDSGQAQRSERQGSSLDDMAELARREGRELTLMKVRTSLCWNAGETEYIVPWKTAAA